MSTKRDGAPRLAACASWAVLGASFGLSAATWIALAELAGFRSSIPVPVTGGRVHLAWLMPVAVDGYVVVALVLWMSPVPARVAGFARANTYTAAGVGVAAQSAYHALTAWSATGVPWRAVLAAVVGALPPAVAALCVHMRALLHRESTPATVPDAVAPPVVDLDENQAVTPVTRSAALVPVPAETFHRLNNTTVHSGAAQ